MGYVPPSTPTGWGTDGKWSPYQSYLRDLYGPPRRDWMPLWNYTFLAGLFALPLAIVWAVLRWA